MRRVLITVMAIAIALPLGAAEVNPSKRQRELIVELLELANGGKTMNEVMKTVLAQYEKQGIARAEASGDVPSDLEERKELYALLHEELATIDIPAELAESAIRIYAKHYTERELADLVASYRMPTGRRSIEVLPEVVRETADASNQILEPILREASWRAVRKQDEKRRPWKPTMKDMRAINVAIGEYWKQRDDSSFPLGNFESLKDALVPKYASELPANDMWGTPYGYVASADGQHFRIVSAGSDRKFERDSLRIVVAADGKSSKVMTQSKRPEDDIILEDLVFVQYPVLTKP